MPAKFMIHTNPVSHRFKSVTKSGVIAWEEGCLKCAVCVKKECVYGVYEDRGLDSRQMIDSIDNQCMNCFRCVQNCPKQLIHKSANPEFKALGDPYWTPDIIAGLWSQAETGKIPVSGAGYPGPFSGPGFDSMWTDMSEIVRPTRDGIHGREYISTAIDLGRTARNLEFTESGALKKDPSSLIDLPLPIIMRVPSFGSLSRDTIKGWAAGAAHMGTFLHAPQDMITQDLDEYAPHVMPSLSQGPKDVEGHDDSFRLIEIQWGEDWEKALLSCKKKYPSALISIRIDLTEGVEKKVTSLVESGASIVHLEATSSGKAQPIVNLEATSSGKAQPIVNLEAGSSGRAHHDTGSVFIKDAIRSVHLTLVEKGLRDGVTLLASGGIAMAEHVAKSIICGADGVLVDFPLLIALECRMCRRCTKGLSCPVEVDKAPSGWVSARVVNLLGAWHNQLLEVMGAMGIRDVRRLRGEAGRAMFFEDLDKATFESMGTVEEGDDLE